MRPRIVQIDGQIGFYWATSAGVPISLQRLVVDDDEADRLVATHLEALDDALIIAAERFGEILGGGRGPADAGERDDLLDLHRTLDRLCLEYASATDLAQVKPDLRAGKIIGTAALFSIRARNRSGCWDRHRSTGSLMIPPSGWWAASERCSKWIRPGPGWVAVGWLEPKQDNAFRSPCRC